MMVKHPICELFALPLLYIHSSVPMIDINISIYFAFLSGLILPVFAFRRTIMINVLY